MTDNKKYPPLPAHKHSLNSGSFDQLYTADQMRAYVDADRAMRAANAKPVAWRRLCYREWEYEDGITSFEHDPSAQALYTEPQATPASQDALDAARYQYLKSIAVQTADPLGPIFSITIRRIDQDGVWGNVSATIDAHIAAKQEHKP